MKKLLTALISAAVLVGVSSISYAVEREKTLTFGFMAGEQWYDSNRRESHSSVFAIHGGYNFNTNWAVEGLFQWATPEAVQNGVKLGRHSPEWKVSGNVVYNFPMSDVMVPYLTAGAGWRNADNAANPTPTRFDSSDFMTNVGGGLKYFVTDNLALRVDARYYMDMEDDNGYNGNDFAVLAGIHITFGAPKPEPVPVPIVQVAPKAPKPMAPADSDGDGVTDDRDKCPNTPRGTKVDKDGCPVVMVPQRMEIEIEFDFDSAQIRPAYHAALGDVAAFMEKHSNAVATIEGHTDSTGPESYNQSLSERRSNSISDYLASKKNISAGRLKTVGYGESRPVADNGTRDGRQRNRRVIAVIIEAK